MCFKGKMIDSNDMSSLKINTINSNLSNMMYDTWLKPDKEKTQIVL